MSQRDNEGLLPTMKPAARVLLIQTSSEGNFRRSALSTIAEVAADLGHHTVFSPDYVLINGEEPEIILIDGTARGVFDTLAQLQQRDSGQHSQIIALLPKHAREEFLENLSNYGVNDFLRAEAPRFEVRSRLESALALCHSSQEISTLREQAALQVRRDDITGVMSRRFFFQQAYRECTRSRRYGRRLSCLMIEVDHYKTLCSTYSEAAGEYVLRVLAFIVGQWTRDSDVIARFSDAKFVILLPETSLQQACTVSEKLLTAFEGHRWHYDGDEIPVSVSIGEAELRLNPAPRKDKDCISEGDEFGDASLSTREALAGLLEDADAALYIASKAARVPEVFVPYTDVPNASLSMQSSSAATFQQIVHDSRTQANQKSSPPES